MEYEKKIFICEDSLEGIFTGIYEGWLWGAKGLPAEIVTREPQYPEFFCTCLHISPDTEKAHKVARSVRRKLGYETYEAICYAAVSAHQGKGTAIFRVLLRAFKGGRCRRDVMEALADPDVNLVSRLRTKVWHEAHRYYGFVRFRDVGGGVLFSKITPENDILEILAPHFADRLSGENWIIYDELRKKAVVHKRLGAWMMTDIPEDGWKERMMDSCDQEEFESLWKTFHAHIAIEERTNPVCQRGHLPLRFRPYMTEFKE